MPWTPPPTPANLNITSHHTPLPEKNLDPPMKFIRT